MADSIKIGNLDISYFKVGGADCSIYLGDVKMYPTTPPTPPAFEGKWLATYDGGSTSSAECDASSAITNGEIPSTNLLSVEIGSCVNSIDDLAFYNIYGDYNSLTSVTISNSVTTIGDYAFSRCNLTSIDIPDSVTNIGQQAFRNCSGLTSITIPDSVTNIGDSAFGGCISLTNVTIGSGITSIDDSAFYNCTSLTSITINAINPPELIDESAFYKTPIANGTGTIYVPSASVSAYQSASEWSTYASRIQAIPNS